jgi:flagellar biosynthesis chaperone FliJ
MFVTRDQQEALANVHAMEEESEEDTRTALRTIDQRLAAIEAKLDQVTAAPQ